MNQKNDRKKVRERHTPNTRMRQAMGKATPPVATRAGENTENGMTKSKEGRH